MIMDFVILFTDHRLVLAVSLCLLPFCLVVGASFMGHSESNLIKLPFTLENYQAAKQ